MIRNREEAAWTARAAAAPRVPGALLGVVFALVVVGVFYAEFLFGGGAPIRLWMGDAGRVMLLPLTWLGMTYVSAGQLPLWNPYVFLGMPLLGDSHAAPLDVFNLPYLFVAPATAYAAVQVLTMFAGCLAMYLFLNRALSYGALAAAAGSLVYVLNGWALAYAELRGSNILLVYIPLALWTLDRAWAAGGIRFTVLAGVVLAMTWTSALLTYAPMVLVLLGLYAAFGTREASLARRLTVLGQAAAISLLLAAVFLLPLAEFVVHSQRQLTTGGYQARNFLPWTHLIGFLVPLTGFELQMVGTIVPPTFYMYAGTVTLVLAAIALRGAGDRRTRCLAAIGLGTIAALLVLRVSALRDLQESLPLLRGQELFRAGLVYYPIALAMLVASGFATAQRTGAEAARAVGRRVTMGLLVVHVALVAALALAVIAVNVFWTPLTQLVPGMIDRAAASGLGLRVFSRAFYIEKVIYLLDLLRTPGMLLVLAAIAGCRLASLFAARRWLDGAARWSGAAVVALLAAELIITWHALLPFTDGLARAYRPTNELGLVQSRVAGTQDRALALHQAATGDSAAFEGFDRTKLTLGEAQDAVRRYLRDYPNSLNSNVLLMFRIPEFGGANSLFPARYLEYVDGMDRPMDYRHGRRDLARHEVRFRGVPDHRLFDLAGMRYVLSPYPLPEPKFRLLMDRRDSDRGYFVYENADALPRAFVASRAEVVAHADVLRRLQAPDFDPRRTVLLEPAVGTTPPADGGTGQARIAEYGPTRVAIDVTAEGPAYLVLTDTIFPGWTADVDGVAAPIHTADYLFRAVAVPAGAHRVTFSYQPRSVVRGAGVSGATVLGLLALGIARRRSRVSTTTPSVRD